MALQSPTSGHDPVSPSAAKWVLALLTCIAMVQFFDRAMMVVIMEPIKNEFGLNDTQLGIFAGFSYAFAFALAGIPLGWLADRINRKRLLAGLMALWSGMVFLATQSGSYVALIAARVGIGATDAGGQPSSVSIIADLYPPERRASAVAVYYMGVPLGMAAGFLLGGMLTAALGWRGALLFAALPGLALTVCVWFFVKEPVRGQSDDRSVNNASTQSQEPPTVTVTLRFMWQQRSLMYIMAASVLVTAASSAMMSWIASLLVRSHGLGLQEVGLMTAICMGGVGAIGTIFFGRLADRMGAQDISQQPRLMGLMALMIAIFGMGVCLSGHVALVAIFLGLFAACVAGLNGPTYALTQNLVGIRMRGMSVAVLVVSLNLIGVGVGPTLAGILSDVFASRFGSDSVRWAMVCILMSCLPAVYLFWRASLDIRTDVEKLSA